MTLEVWDESVVAEFTEQGFWDELTLAQAVAANAEARPTAAAFIADDGTTLDWAGYDAQSTQLAGLLVGLGLRRGDHVATVMPDGPAVHVAYLAAEKAGLVTVGIGPRSGMAEISHVYNKGGALALITGSELRGREAVDLVHDLREDGCGILHHIVLEGNGSSFSVAVDGGAVSLETPEDMVDRLAGRAVGPNDLFFINSTSGTTGRPKCVMQTQNKWKYFHRNCRQFDPLDRFLVVVPTPFGFGLWMSHFSPTLLGAPCIQPEEFDVDATVRLLESEAVTVLAAVTTQVIMLLGAERLDDADLSHLRIVQSGGERVVYGKAAEFERRADCRLLQFYGSNEAGCISGTRMDDSIDRRLGTSGRVLPEMHTRLIADDGSLVDWPGEGRCAVRGPAISPGYYDDPAADEELFTPEGWLRMPDIVHIDDEGFLTVVGRHSDFIIRAGHNVSAQAVEEQLLEYPRIALAAVVGMPDEVVGERVCAYVTTKDGQPVGLDEIVAFLSSQGVSKTMWPERVVHLDEIPTGVGAKAAKAALAEDIRRRLAEEGGERQSPGQ